LSEYVHGVRIYLLKNPEMLKQYTNKFLERLSKGGLIFGQFLLNILDTAAHCSKAQGSKFRPGNLGSPWLIK
jgi:hypothetical protein